MAETFTNARLDIAGNSLTTLYTVPASTQATAHVAVVNRTETGATFSVALAPLGAADNVSQYVGFSRSITGYSFVDITGFVMAATDEIRVDGSTDTLSFNAFVVEVT